VSFSGIVSMRGVSVGADADAGADDGVGEGDQSIFLRTSTSASARTATSSLNLRFPSLRRRFRGGTSSVFAASASLAEGTFDALMNSRCSGVAQKCLGAFSSSS
jgi:hypothetical protein